jgi:hypothetical protein
MELNELIGSNLNGFIVEEVTEIYSTNEDGRRISSFGCMRNYDVAKAYIEQCRGSHYYALRKIAVITKGNIVFIVGKPITLLDDEKISKEVKEKILKKLSDEEKKILNV